MENKQDSVLDNNNILTVVKELFKNHPKKEFITLDELMKDVPKSKVKYLSDNE